MTVPDPEKPLPSGVVTFLFSDIQGSTPLWEKDPVAMRVALDQHHAIIRETIERNGGQVFQIVGDEFCSAFVDPAAGVAAALAGQRGLAAAEWGSIGPLKVRMGLHMGQAKVREGDYISSHTINRVARIMGAAHGGQILLSGEVADRVRRTLPEGVSLKDLGQHRMKGTKYLEHIYQLLAPDLPADFPPIGSLPLFTTNLPPQPTPFIGRNTELSTLHDFIFNDDASLVTIVGPGGMGKTRLALAFADRLVEQQSSTFPDGIYFVNLVPLETVEYIVPTLDESLHFLPQDSKEDKRSPRQKVLDYLKEKRLLLIMDNFEHLLDGADLVADILGAAPGVKIIVTSRERLHLRQEQVYPISGLEFPDWEVPEDALKYTAVQLFLQSAQRNLPNFELGDQEELTYLARVCRLVAGMPLAIELAAAWVDTLSLAEIAEEIQNGLDLLETEMRDVPDRHRSVRAAIDYSWQKLTVEEQNIFVQLSVFRGGFTRKAGQAITEASIRLLARLVNKSLLQYNQERDRYQAHEMLRQFGAEMLARDDELETAVRQRHSAYYCQGLGQRTVELQGHRLKDAIEEIELDIENVHSAWNWAVTQGKAGLVEKALDGLLAYFKFRGSYAEGQEQFAAAADVLPSSNLTYHRLRSAEARCRQRLGDYEGARPYYEQALAIREEVLGADHPDTAKSLNNMGELLHEMGDYAGARPYYEQALAIREKVLGITHPDTAVSLNNLGLLLQAMGDYEEARPYYERALAIREKVLGAEHPDTALSLNGMGYLLRAMGDYAGARPYYERALAIREKVLGAEHPDTAQSLNNLGYLIRVMGNLAEARPYYERALAIREKVLGAEHLYTAHSLNNLGKLLQAIEDYEGARPYFERSLTIREKMLGTEHPATARGISNMGVLLRTMGDLARAQPYLERALAIQEKVLGAEHPDIARSLNNLGELLQAMGDLAGAQPYFEQALTIREKVLGADHPDTAESLSNMGLLLEAVGDLDGAKVKLEQALAVYEAKLGAEHPTTEEVRENLARLEAVKEIGRSIDANYVQEELIATGGMGEVYLGRDTGTGQQVAIKRLKPELARQNPQLIARFAREGEALRRLNHPNIVTVLATIEDENAPTIIMEYVGGGDLQQLIESQAGLPLDRVLDIALELSDALSRAHHLGIIHRDLKPANVLLAEDGTPRLTDFGIARLEQQGTRLTQEGTFMGSPAYLSPEVAQGHEADHRSDIWAFGVMLYEMVTGQNPFDRKRFKATLVAVLTATPPDIGTIRPDVPPELGTLIGEMLVKERDGRLASMRQAGAQLEEIRRNLS